MTTDPEPEPVVCSTNCESAIVDTNTGGIHWTLLADLLEVQTGMCGVCGKQVIGVVCLLLHTLRESIKARPKLFRTL